MKYQVTTIKIIITQKTTDIDKCSEKKEPLYIVREKVKWYNKHGK